MTHLTHKRYLTVTAVSIALFAPILFLATMPGTQEVARFTLDILAWPIDGYPAYQTQEIRFLSALTGGFLLGWGILVWMISGRIYDAEPELVRWAVLVSCLSWFVLDCAGSIASGTLSNAIFNVPVLLLFVGPLWVPARD